MINSIKYFKDAEQELIETIGFYNDCSLGLGNEFLTEIKKAINMICEYPKLFPLMSKYVRKCTCSRFPYNILYYLKDKSIYIVAIMHQKRRPNYWIDRIN
jgi:plasmid stabilization system protein ParE